MPYLGVGRLDMSLGLVMDKMPVLGLHNNLHMVDIHCCGCNHCCLQTLAAHGQEQEVAAESLVFGLEKLNNNYY